MTSGADERNHPASTSWKDACAVYRERLLEYHAQRGADLDSARVKSNVDNNTVHIPARGDHLVRMLDELAGVELTGRTVLDLGCGFGGLAAYLACRERPRRLVAIDVSEPLLAVAREAVRRARLDGPLTFVKADMRDLSPLGPERFDVAIANGVIFYMTTRADLTQALRELHRVLAPGGWLLFYHSNKWRWTDPFTDDPLVHLLPPRTRAAVSRFTGWKSHEGVRLVSAPELRRALRRLGFSRIEVIGFGKERRHTHGPARFFGQRYALSARRDG